MERIIQGIMEITAKNNRTALSLDLTPNTTTDTDSISMIPIII